MHSSYGNRVRVHDPQPLAPASCITIMELSAESTLFWMRIQSIHVKCKRKRYNAHTPLQEVGARLVQAAFWIAIILDGMYMYTNQNGYQVYNEYTT